MKLDSVMKRLDDQARRLKRQHIGSDSGSSDFQIITANGEVILPYDTESGRRVSVVLIPCGKYLKMPNPATFEVECEERTEPTGGLWQVFDEDGTVMNIPAYRTYIAPILIDAPPPPDIRQIVPKEIPSIAIGGGNLWGVGADREDAAKRDAAAIARVEKHMANWGDDEPDDDERDEDVAIIRAQRRWERTHAW